MALFDVAEHFNRSLARARRERGEPTGGVERAIWEAAQLPRKALEKQPAWVGIALSAAAVVALWGLSERKRGQTRVLAVEHDQEKAA